MTHKARSPFPQEDFQRNTGPVVGGRQETGSCGQVQAFNTCFGPDILIPELSYVTHRVHWAVFPGMSVKAVEPD